MMSKTLDKPKPNNNPLTIILSYNPKKSPDISRWILSCTTEHYGIHLEDRKNTPTNKEMVFLFEKNKDGQDFFNVISNTNLQVRKEV